MKRSDSGVFYHSSLGIANAARAHSETDDEVRMTLPVASSVPLWRWGAHEILELNGNTDLRFMTSGNAPLLLHHNPSDIIGRVVSGEIRNEMDGSQTLMATICFRKDDKNSADAWKRVKSGILRNVSISWSAGKDGAEYEKEGHNNEPTFTFRGFRVLEVSFVSIPADSSVGVGRGDAEKRMKDMRCIARGDDVGLPEAKNSSEKKMDKDENPNPTEPEAGDPKRSATPAPAPVPAPVPAPAPAPAPVAADPAVPPAPVQLPVSRDAVKWINENKARLEQRGVKKEIIETLWARAYEGADVDELNQIAMNAVVWGAPGGTIPTETKAPAIHDPLARHNYFNFQRLCKEGVLLGEEKPDGLEAEMLSAYDEANKKIPNWIPSRRSRNSIFVPHGALMNDPLVRQSMLSRCGSEMRNRIELKYAENARAYAVGSSPSGHFNEVFNEANFVEALIAESQTLQLFRRLPQQLMQDLIGVVESGEITVSHTSESGTISESPGLTFGNRTFKWHQITGRKDTTLRTLDQSMFFWPRVQEVLTRDMIRGMNKATINGTGSATPTGILNFAGLDVVELGDNGAAPTYGKLVDLYTQIHNNNAEGPDMCFIMTSAIKGEIQKIARFTGSQGNQSDQILHGMGMMRDIDGYKVIRENNLPKNLTKGTSSDCHAVIFGNFMDAELGFFSGVEFSTDPYTQMETSGIRIYIRQAYDFLPRHVDSFGAFIDARVS